MKKIKTFLTVVHTELHNNSYFKKVLFSYILIACITFIIFSTAILSVMQKQHRKEMQDINTKNIEQAYSFNNSVLQDISTYCYTALDSVAVRNLIYADEYDIVTAINSRNTYESFQKISSTILSIDFVNFMTDTVLTKTGRYSLEKFEDQGLLSLLQELTPRSTPYFCYPREIPYNNGNQSANRRVISMIYYFHSNGALIINLDYDTYYSLLNFNAGNDTFQMLLINMDGKVIASTDNDLFMCDFQTSPLYHEIQETDNAKGTLTFTDDSGKYSVAYHKATQMGITYISMFTLENHLHESSIFTLTLHSSILYLIVTLLLSLLSSYLIYNPIRKLKTAIHPSDSDMVYVEHNHKNDFEFLESVYQQLIENNTALTKYKRGYAEKQQQKLLWMLMNDTGNLSVPRQDLEALDAEFEYLNYLVFIINIEFDSTKQNIEADVPLYKFMVQNVTNELFESYADLKYLDMDFSRLIFVGSFKEYDKQLLKRIILQIQQFFQDVGLFRCSVGFSAPVTELENLSNAYDTAKTALINGRMKTINCIQFYDELALIAPNKQQYPYEADQSILAALKAQNADSCHAAVEAFFSIIQNYHYNQIYRSVAQLDAALQRFEYTNELFQHLPEITWNNETLFSLDELITFFQERCRADIQALVEIKTHSFAKTELISDVNAFIEEHIYNPNLSVAMIAEKVDLSINYLRNIYKENTGESLTAYIANRKLTLVCEMLSDTNIPIQDISDKLGFTTKNYFFTFFKKHMNMTPTQYRSMHQSK